MSLNFPAFRPHPLVRGGHLQTIVGCYLRPQSAQPATTHQVPLPDGDAIAVHDDGSGAGLQPATDPDQETRSLRWRKDAAGETPAPHWRPGDPVALLLHGLGGCHQSGYMVRCSAKLRARGVRVFRMDLRGCGAGFALARHPIHAGRSEDAAAALSFVIEQCPDSPVHLIGFSMGANIVLKLAGEVGDQGPANLASVMAVSPPIDLIECSRNIQRGWNRLYDRRFVRGLLDHIRRRSKMVPDALTRPLNPLPRRLFDFDERFTAPLAGFADATDYYQRASSGPLLQHIAVPALIVAAANDPIIPIGCFEAARYAPATKLVVTPCGGHLGFVAARGQDPDCRWLDWRVVEWVASRARQPAASEAAASPIAARLNSQHRLAIS